jgi:hypothetical protein
MTTATEDMVTCDSCEREIEESTYDVNDGLCPACLARTFMCGECEERTLKAEVHAHFKNLCESCGESKAEEERQEALDAAAEELRELVESIIDGDDLAVVRKALATLKRVAK